MDPFTILSLVDAGFKAVGSAIWGFISKPPGTYIACVLALVAGVWWWGHHQYNAGVADNEAAHQAVQLVVDNKITVANIGLADAVAASSAKALTDMLAADRHLNDLLTLQLSEVFEHVTADIDKRYPLPCGLIRMWDAGALAVSPSSLPTTQCGPDDAVAPTKASDLANAALVLWQYAGKLEDRVTALTEDDEGLRMAWDDYRNKLIAAGGKEAKTK
jgi:hypothetical protein